MSPKYTRFAQPLAWLATTIAAVWFLVFVFKDPTPRELPPRQTEADSGSGAPEPPPPEPVKLTPEIIAADAALNALVEAALKANPDTNSFKIRVQTRNGVVRITGDVNGGNEKDAVSAVAKSVAGVTFLTNDITVHDRDNGH